MKKKPARTDFRQAGFLLLALVFVILVLGVAGYAFINVVSTHRLSAPGSASTMKALYIKEAAFEIGHQYVAEYWTTGTTVPLGQDVLVFSNEPLGDGSFSLWVTMTDIRVADFRVSATVAE